MLYASTPTQFLLRPVDRDCYNRKHCLAIFLDITSALTVLAQNVLGKRLLEKGCDPLLVGWYMRSNARSHPGMAFKCRPHTKSFRPISLSNYFLKALEKLMNWKIDEDLRKKPITQGTTRIYEK